MIFPALFTETNSVYFFLGMSTPTMLRCIDLLQWPKIQVSFKTLVIIIFRRPLIVCTTFAYINVEFLFNVIVWFLFVQIEHTFF